MLFLLTLMLVERMLFRVRDNETTQTVFFAKHRLLIKFIIYIVLVLYIHIVFTFKWPTYGLWLSTTAAVKFYYILFLAYFYFSGLQISKGFPRAPYKQTFLRDTSPLYVGMYYAYKVIPFVWEMKVITDWTVTNTCLDLF